MGHSSQSVNELLAAHFHLESILNNFVKELYIRCRFSFLASYCTGVGLPVTMQFHASIGYLRSLSFLQWWVWYAKLFTGMHKCLLDLAKVNCGLLVFFFPNPCSTRFRWLTTSHCSIVRGHIHRWVRCPLFHSNELDILVLLLHLNLC